MKQECLGKRQTNQQILRAQTARLLQGFLQSIYISPCEIDSGHLDLRVTGSRAEVITDVMRQQSS